jgi:NADPH:quinone reductase-like Zn-dependent oxidoreductase
VRVHGLYVGSVSMFEDFVRALDVSKIEPVIDKVFPFAEARAAYEHLHSGQHFGKVVIRVE